MSYFKNLDELVLGQIGYYSESHPIKNEDLLAYCEELGIHNLKRTSLRADIIQAILDAGITTKQIYDHYKGTAFGLHPCFYTDVLKVTQSQRLKMMDQGFITVVYKVPKRINGNYVDVPYYDAEEFFALTPEAVESWKEANIRGYKKRKEKEREKINAED